MGHDLTCLQRSNESLHVGLFKLVQIFLEENNKRGEVDKVGMQAQKSNFLLRASEDRLAERSVVDESKHQLFVSLADLV